MAPLPFTAPLAPLPSHSQARSPVATWQPSELTLVAPLLIVSHLPRPLEIQLTQRATLPTRGGRQHVDRDLLNHLSKVYVEPPLPEDETPTGKFTIGAKATHRIHSFHAWRCLQLRAWVQHPHLPVALHGHLELCLPETTGHKTHPISLNLHPPGKPRSTRAFVMHVEVVAHGAQCEVRSALRIASDCFGLLRMASDCCGLLRIASDVAQCEVRLTASDSHVPPTAAPPPLLVHSRPPPLLSHSPPSPSPHSQPHPPLLIHRCASSRRTGSATSPPCR